LASRFRIIIILTAAQMNCPQRNDLLTTRMSELIQIEGIYETLGNKGGQVIDPKHNGKTKPNDPFVPKELVKRLRLQQGSFITANANHHPKFPNPKVSYVETVDGQNADERRRFPSFQQLTTITPEQQLTLESKDGRITTRVIDMFCPIGKGTRGLIVAPPRTGKTTLLQDIAQGVLENHPECHVMVLLVDERPEEVTDFKRTIPTAELFASSNDEEVKSHIRIAELAIERAKRLVETGKDVVLLLDSITRLARAYNAAKSSGRTMSGGLDVRALEKPRQLFSAARRTEDGGSLTIIASALIETGSRMDDLIFQEFKGTGNMEMVLDRKVAEMRIWPAINLNASGTRKEELLLSQRVQEGSSFLRRAMASMKIEDAAETMLERFSKTKNNEEFLRLLEV